MGGGGGKGEKWRRGKRRTACRAHSGLLSHSDSVLFILHLEGTCF